MFTERYEPKRSIEIIGNESQINETREWLRKGKGALLIYGPPGCGKSLAIKLLAKELGYDLLENHASDDRSLASLRELLDMSKQKSLFLRKKLILIDEIELLESVKGINELIKNIPVVLISSEYDNRFDCRKIRFDKIPADKIARFLRTICMKEGVACDDKTIYQLARMSNGDVRAALIDLESGYGYRESEKNIFEKLRLIFKSDAKNAKNALMDSDPNELLLWTEENIPLEYRNIEDIANAYDCLSKADLFRARIIKRQAWNLEKYFLDFLCGIPKSKLGFTLYNKPNIKKLNSGLREKISKRLHVSKKESREYFDLVRLLAKKEPEIIERLGLDEGDLELLGG